MKAALRFANAVLPALALVLTSGCNTVSGVRRSVAVSQAPSTDAVDASLRDVPRITAVSFYRDNTSGARIEQFYYSAADLAGVVEIQRHTNGQNTVSLYREWKNRQPTPQELDETRALMDAVYTSLRRHVPDLPPASEVKEELIRPPQ